MNLNAHFSFLSSSSTLLFIVFFFLSFFLFFLSFSIFDKRISLQSQFVRPSVRPNVQIASREGNSTNAGSFTEPKKWNPFVFVMKFFFQFAC